MNFKDYSDYYIDNILSMKKPATQASMKCHIRRGVESFGSLNLNDLTEQLIQKHISSLINDLQAKSLSNYWTTIRLILERARKEGFIPVVPEPELPKIFKKKQPCLTTDEMRSIIEASDGKFRLLAELLSESGCRSGEAFALRPSDINLDRCTLNITRSIWNGKEQNPKSANAIREISISSGLAERLVKCRKNSIFTQSDNRRDSRTHSQYYRKLLSGHLRRLNINAGGFHAFRRGNASLMASLGVPEHIIRYRLGHAGGVTAGYIQTPVGADKVWAEKIAASIR